MQRCAIEAEASRRGWEVEWIVDQGETGKNADRPGLARALALVERGEAEALVVSRLDRLSRSVVDFGSILQRVTKPRGRKAKPWGLVALDIGIDMTQPTGRLVAHILISVAEWEGEIISERTRAGLAQAKARGVRVGAVSQMDPKVVTQMRRLRSRGWSFDKIADHLNDRGVQVYASTAPQSPTRSGALRSARDAAQQCVDGPERSQAILCNTEGAGCVSISHPAPSVS